MVVVTWMRVKAEGGVVGGGHRVFSRSSAQSTYTKAFLDT
jgi:hypothetical protein